jgi:hypothetical protein
MVYRLGKQKIPSIWGANQSLMKESCAALKLGEPFWLVEISKNCTITYYAPRSRPTGGRLMNELFLESGSSLLPFRNRKEEMRR